MINNKKAEIGYFQLLKKIFLTALIIIIIAMAYKKIFTPSFKVVFISDTHAVNDALHRDTQWNLNSFHRIKALFQNSEMRPTHLLWLGDITDFLPSEWDIVKSWLDWIATNSYRVKQYALMGNHDYIYYKYPEIQTKFNSINSLTYLSHEIESTLTQNVKSGDIKIFVKDASEFFLDKQILLIQTPDYDTKNLYFIGEIKSINKKNNSLTLKHPITENFFIETTAVRQGFSEQHGISQFLKTFKGTETTATNNIFFENNICIITLSMDNYFNYDLKVKKSYALSESDFNWLEDQLKKNYQKFHIIIATHELPESGQYLNGLYDPQDVIDFHQDTRNRFMRLAQKYKVLAWISGHTHPDARLNNVHSEKNGTHFFLVPSLGMNPEGQMLMLVPNVLGSSLNFQYWSIDKKSIFKEYKIKLTEK